jgi:ATP-dependent Clp protease protease subunit
MRPCFAFSNVGAKDKTPASLSIFEEIGMWGVQAKDFVTQLGTIKASGQTELAVEISSPGGSVADALAMYNGLRASGLSITTKVMGAAMSAASLVFMAGEKRVMPKNTYLMLHNPSTIVGGNAEDMRDAADMLDKIGGLVRATYSTRSGIAEDKLAEILSKDSFFSADESVALGLATEVIEDVTATAHFDMEKAELPAHVRAAYGVKAEADPDKNPEDPDGEHEEDSHGLIEQIQAAAATAKVSEFADVIALSCADLVAAKARIATAREIKALCVLLKKPDEAAGLVKANKTLAEARTELALAAAKDDVVTSSALPVKPNTPVVSEGQKLWKELRARHTK